MNLSPHKEFINTTEQASRHRHLEKMSVQELLTNINEENTGVPAAVHNATPATASLVSAAADKMPAAGHLFYPGAGTGGSPGILAKTLLLQHGAVKKALSAISSR
ncbi:hypothetical protein [uncultured Chitinophaga sp.]|jgi:Predicted sugar phosphate isomerase|uniref:hypothetical protein n=1 Tax=uncultured Chitinophaga sp. TaxID=339340 RepID=UPI002625EF71|nr:hypothetical protein [uncultured Chitinophaga sp.]